jgi:hypothetical protein
MTTVAIPSWNSLKQLYDNCCTGWVFEEDS